MNSVWPARYPPAPFMLSPMCPASAGTAARPRRLLLSQAQVATVPGVVFGPQGEGHVRFSFSTSIETIQAGLESMRRNL